MSVPTEGGIVYSAMAGPSVRVTIPGNSEQKEFTALVVHPKAYVVAVAPCRVLSDNSSVKRM